METFDIKFLSKEPKPAAAPSFRIYYGDAPGAIPFTWETTPGTPKHDYFSDSNPPPLTPPPSYSYSVPKSKNSSTISSGRSWRSYSSSNVLQHLFKSKSKHLRHQSERGSQRSLSTLSSSSFSSWTSSSTGTHGTATSGKRQRRTRRGLSWGSSSFDNVGGDDHHPRIQSDGRLSRSVKYCFSRFCFPVSIRSE